MDATLAAALETGGVADITTVGRRTGLERRIEINFHNLDGDLYLTGRPGPKRDWLANLAADPRFTLHLTRGPLADLAAEADVIIDSEERRRVLARLLIESWKVEAEKAEAVLPRWVEDAPLVRFRLL